MIETLAAVMRLAPAMPIAVAALLFVAGPAHAQARPADSQVIEAARAGDAKRVGILIDQGGSADAADAAGRTALMAAVEGGHREVVALLIARKADIWRKAKDGSTALSLAIRAGRQEILAAVLKATSLTGFAEYTPETPTLVWAAFLRDAAAVKACIAKGGDDLKRHGGMALVTACGWGAPDVAKILLDAGVPADPDGVDDTPLGSAASSVQDAQAAIVRMLLAKGAKVDRTNKSGQTPLIMAARAGDVEAIRALLDAGAKTNLRDKDGQTAAQAAQAEGRGEVVAMLRRHATGGERSGLRVELARAVKAGNAKRLAELLAKGGDANTRCDDGNTLLIMAAAKGDLAAVQLLLERGADANARSLDSGKRTALIEAAEAGHSAVAAMLLDHGADVNARMVQGYPALMRAVSSAATMRVLLDHHADVNARDDLGETALIWACSHGSLDVVRMLLDHGADLKRDGAQALGSAAREDLAGQVVRLLLGRGVPAESRNRDGVTALSRAAATGNLEAVKALISHGADVNSTSGTHNDTPLLSVACGSPSSTDVVRALVQAGADVNARSRDGMTALMWLAAHGEADAVQLLLAKGARLDPNDWEGRSALQWAVTCKHKETAAILRKAGAKE